VWICIVSYVWVEFPSHVYPFLWFVSENGVGCPHVSHASHCSTEQIFVCVRVIGMREGGECWN
jgi:hypothetical protein